MFVGAADLGEPHFRMGLLILTAALFTLVVVAALLYRRGLNELADASGTTLFSTAGLLYLLGALLTIVVVGVILLLAAYVLMAAAFFTMGRGVVWRRGIAATTRGLRLSLGFLRLLVLVMLSV